MVILQLIHVSVTDFQEGLLLSVTKPTQTLSGLWVSLGNNSNLVASASGASHKCRYGIGIPYPEVRCARTP